MSRMQRFEWFRRQRVFRTQSSPRHDRRLRPRLLRLEPLEDRRMLAVITVTSLVDNLFPDGGVTLREAIQAANTDTSFDGSVAGSGADTIEFAAALAGQPVLLGGTPLEITEALTIVGLGSDQTTIDAQQDSRIFEIGNFGSNDFDVTFTGLNLTNGRTAGDFLSGGAVYARTTGHFTITHSVITGNRTSGDRAFGGAIHARGDMTLIDSTLSDNRTAGDYAVGGGLHASGSLTVVNSTITGNRTAGFRASGGGVSVNGDATFIDSDIASNSTAGERGYGGGIAVEGNLELTTSTVSSNTTTGFASRGGGIRARSLVTIADSTIADNQTFTTSADGGSLFALGPVEILRSSVSNNSTAGGDAEGGGIHAFGNITLHDSLVSGNSTSGSFSYGGGLYSKADIAVFNSTISGNVSMGDNSDGGGLLAQGGVIVAHSTITDNHADSVGGHGGGIGLWRFTDNQLQVQSSIIAANTASQYPDIYSQLPNDTITVTHSLIGAREGTSLVEAQMTDVNGNLIGSLFGMGVIDPELGPLSDNGGATETHALLPDSPAIDAGDPTFVGPPDYDQRGFAFDRMVSGRIDIGAVESGAASANFDTDGDVDGVDFLTWQRGFGGASVLHADGDANLDGVIDAADLTVWQSTYGQVETTPFSVVMGSAEELVDSAVLAFDADSTDPSPTGVTDSADLIHAAMAWQLASDSEETASLPLEPPPLDVELPTDAALTRHQFKPAEASVFEDAVAVTENENDDDAQWLTDELLESVFG